MTMSEHTLQFPYPIVPGDFPDPTVLRVGDDYFMTHSSFEYVPGLLMWHSRDLLHWRSIGYALTRYIGSVWAPDLVEHGGRYFIYFPAGGTNWVVTAPTPHGPWDDPVDLDVRLIDPGHVVAADGRRYLYLSGGNVVPLADDGLSVTGAPRIVYEGWSIPPAWRIEGRCLEGPKLLRRGRFYYMLSAMGGTAGPATSHMVVVARSDDALGPWRDSPYNPLIHTSRREERWRSRGHGSLVEGPDGRWYCLYHAYEDEYRNLGRQTLIEPITWSADGWPVAGSTPDGTAAGEGPATGAWPDDMRNATPLGAPTALATEIEADRYEAEAPRGTMTNASPEARFTEFVDEFRHVELGPHWRAWRGEALRRLSTGNGLTLQAVGESHLTSSPVAMIPRHHAYEVEVEVEVSESCEAALLLYYNERAAVGVSYAGDTVYAVSHYGRTIGREVASRRCTLRLVNDCNEIDLYAGGENEAPVRLARGFEVSGFHHNVLGCFLSLRVALCAYGAGHARFHRFRYRGVPDSVHGAIDGSVPGSD